MILARAVLLALLALGVFAFVNSVVQYRRTRPWVSWMEAVTYAINAPDRFREAHFALLPVWLDDKDWKTWLWHTVIAMVLGTVIGIIMLDLYTGWLIGAEVYAVREWLNVRDRERDGLPLKPLDHMGDSLLPLAGAVLLITYVLPHLPGAAT